MPYFYVLFFYFYFFSQGDVFKSMLDKYMRKALRKGIPPLFVDLVPLYENKSKASIIGNLCQGKKMNTRGHEYWSSPCFHNCRGDIII